MRLVSYGTELAWRCGIQIDDSIYDTSAVAHAAGLGLDHDTIDWTRTKEVIAAEDRVLQVLERTAKALKGSRINAGN